MYPHARSVSVSDKRVAAVTDTTPAGLGSRWLVGWLAFLGSGGVVELWKRRSHFVSPLFPLGKSLERLTIRNQLLNTYIADLLDGDWAGLDRMTNV
jgi:hypothetical protein